MPAIRIDDEVYAWLQKQAKPFEDSPNSVLRRIAGFDAVRQVMPPKQMGVLPHVVGRKTPQRAFREPILKIILRHGGTAQRATVLRELEKSMAGQLTTFDKADIKSGTIRWQKSAEWEVRVMREQGLLKPASHAPHGTWSLTDKGRKAAE